MGVFVENLDLDLQHLDATLLGRDYISLMEVWHEALWQPRENYKTDIVTYLIQLLFRLNWRKVERHEHLPKGIREMYYRKRGGQLFVRNDPVPNKVEVGSVTAETIRRIFQTHGGSLKLGPVIEKAYGIDLHTYPHDITTIRLRVESVLRASGWKATSEGRYKGKTLRTFSKVKTRRCRKVTGSDMLADILG